MLSVNIKSGRLSMIYKFILQKIVFLFFLGLLISITAKDQSRSKILNETRKGVSEAFKSIFK